MNNKELNPPTSPTRSDVRKTQEDLEKERVIPIPRAGQINLSQDHFSVLIAILESDKRKIN